MGVKERFPASHSLGSLLSPGSQPEERNRESQGFAAVANSELQDHLPALQLLCLAGSAFLFLALSVYQLQLPGLHYDEAREAGLNAMQLVTGQPLTAFRDAVVRVGPWQLPLMVQDYIGALNVVLAVPFLALGGVNVPALRALPILIGLLTLLVTHRVAWHLAGPAAASVAGFLLAVNPSFVFWSRQGIFVTNLTALLLVASLLAGLRWWSGRRPADLWLMAFLWGLGLYTKLLFVWGILAMALAAGVSWAGQRIRGAKRPAAVPAEGHARPQVRPVPGTWLPALACFLLPLTPLLLFNLRTGGTATTLFGNLSRSYYGVDNAAYLPNLLTRLAQLRTLLRGDHLWYLGGIFANGWAPWLAGGLMAVSLGTWAWQRNAATDDATPVAQRGWPPLLPLVLLALIVAQSAFTVSDLFITHYALLLPLIPLTAGVAAAGLMRLWGCPGLLRRSLAGLALLAALIWAGGDLWTTLRYHRSLSVSGGRAAHSDAIYALAEYLEKGGLIAPLALDWGLDAPVRFLTAGRVNPIEVFGYADLAAPDPAFADRLTPFLDNPDNVYLAHAAGQTVFRGRVEAMTALARSRGLRVQEEARFAERDGTPLFVVYRIGR